MSKMLSRDQPFELNLKEVADYCQTIQNEISEIFSTVNDGGVKGK